MTTIRSLPCAVIPSARSRVARLCGEEQTIPSSRGTRDLLFSPFTHSVLRSGARNLLLVSVRTLVLLSLLILSGSAFPQDFAKARLDKSPRHGEWVQVKHGDRTVHSFIVYPEVKNKATAVVVIHEIFGMSDWVRGVADQLAEAGYIAIAPDLLSGMAPNGGKTSDFPDRSAIGEAFSKLGQNPDQVTGDLNAVADYVAKLPACSGKVAVAGFCWGGGQSFRFATNRKDLAAAFVFYGPPQPNDALAKIKCPVYGFYGGNDARITATVPTVTEQMKAAGKTYDPVTYEGAGHGFMRSGEDPMGTDPNKKARDEAWTRWKGILKKL